LRGALPRGARFRDGESASAEVSPAACFAFADDRLPISIGTSRLGIPNFSINVCASNGARNFTSVLSKKQNTSRGDFVGGFFDEIFSASAGSDPFCHALMRLAHRSSDLSE